MKNIILIGSTGSVGLNACEIARAHPDAFKIVALAAGSNADVLLEQVEEFKPEAVFLANKEMAKTMRAKLPDGVTLLEGPHGLSDVAQWQTGDLLIAASSGSTSLVPVLKAIEAKKDIGIANKEILVMAGGLVVEAARKHDVALLPIDSEHNAIYQCLQTSNQGKGVKRILLTGSGGPLRLIPKKDFRGLKPDFVIKHPKWSMGKKISVDSATMMNKGLEIVEAGWLFGHEAETIDVVVHPEAIVHSMIEFIDGSVIAQLGATDMKLPLIHAMAYPDRVEHVPLQTDWAEWGSLNFEKPDIDKFPCLKFGMEIAAQRQSSLPAVLNAADEEAVDAFLNEKIDFADIPDVIAHALGAHQVIQKPNLENVLETDRWTRATCQQFMEKLWVS